MIMFCIFVVFLVLFLIGLLGINTSGNYENRWGLLTITGGFGMAVIMAIWCVMFVLMVIRFLIGLV